MREWIVGKDKREAVLGARYRRDHLLDDGVGSHDEGLLDEPDAFVVENPRARVLIGMDKDEALPQVVTAYLQEHHGGQYPDANEYRAQLEFIQTCFSDKASRQHRHTILWRLRNQGYTVPRLAHLFGKSERTIKRWMNDMRDWLGDHYTGQEVREIHTNRMADLAAMQAQLNEVAYADKMHAPTRIAAMKAKVAVHAMHDQIMRQAGYYRAFDISKQNTPDQDHAVTINADFIRDIETLTMGGDPLLEYYGEGEEDGREAEE